MPGKKRQLQFKWGSIKGWEGVEGESLELLRKYFADGVPMSAAADKPDEAKKKILVELIEKFPGTFYNEWEGKKMTRAQAIEYVTGYGVKK